MSAGNSIGYYARLIELGKITEEEANAKLKNMFESDIRGDEAEEKIIQEMRMQIGEIHDYK